MRKGSVFQMLARRWWIGLIVFVITFGAVAYLTDQQTPLYSARATYVTRLSDTITEGRDINTALDILNRQKDLLTTYSEVAKSQVIRTNAAQLLDPSGGNYLGMPVSSKVIAGTNLLEISVVGPNPGEVMVYTNAVGKATASYANSLYTTYRVEQLDPAQMPRRPVSPNYGFNLIVGTILGLFIGFGMMLYSVWMDGSLRELNPEKQIDDSQSVNTFQQEIEELRQQSAALRNELSEARLVFRDTVLEARVLGDTLHKANGQNK